LLSSEKRNPEGMKKTMFHKHYVRHFLPDFLEAQSKPLAACVLQLVTVNAYFM